MKLKIVVSVLQQRNLQTNANNKISFSPLITERNMAAF
jgi:hypothetical protein